MTHLGLRQRIGLLLVIVLGVAVLLGLIETTFTGFEHLWAWVIVLFPILLAAGWFGLRGAFSAFFFFLLLHFVMWIRWGMRRGPFVETMGRFMEISLFLFIFSVISGWLMDRLIRARKEAEALAIRDLTTDVYNRRYLEQARLKHSALLNQAYMLLYLDIDRFQWINSLYGHETADALLKAYGQRLKEALVDQRYLGASRSKGFVVRHGGDEFLVVAPFDDQFKTRLKAFQNFLREPFRLGALELSIFSTIGVAVCTRGGWCLEQLLEEATVALQAAKRFSPGEIKIYEPDLDNEPLLRPAEWEQDIKKAVKRGEFFLVYQPIVHVLKRKVTMIEALLRWHHPLRGQISPAQFIPLAESLGLMSEIGVFVLREAVQFLHFLRTRQEEAFNQVYVSVNVSRAQLKAPGFVETVQQALRGYEKYFPFLVIELTESMELTIDESVVHTIQALKALGMTIYLDDFGSGYTSIRQLLELPVDGLKLDRSLLTGFTERSQQIVQALMNLAERLHLDTVIEGVESPVILEKIHVTERLYIQGYIITPPLMPDDLLTRIASIEQTIQSMTFPSIISMS